MNIRSQMKTIKLSLKLYDVEINIINFFSK